MWRHQCKLDATGAKPQPALGIRLDDSGITLEAFDRPRLATSPTSSASDQLNADRGAAELSRLSHKLRPIRCDDVGGLPSAVRSGLLPVVRGTEPSVDPEAPPWDSAPASQMAWGVTLLLAAGLAMLLAGVGSLAWSIRMTDARAAHWGLTAGLAGVGLLTVAIARLTARVWRNSRRLTAQLDGMTEQLEAMRGIAATSALVRAATRRA